MIGQTNLKARLQELIDSKSYPRFSIFVGEKGSGRKTTILDKLKVLGDCQICGVDVDSVRNVIEQAYTQVAPTVYIFADADTMSIAAKNAMLKVTEEPPNNAYFVMTVTSIDGMLATIRSRAHTFYMDSYTEIELMSYCRQMGVNVGECISYCTVPGDIDLLTSYDISDFKEYVTKVVDNIDKVSGANSFKIGSKLNLANDESKYDLNLFFKAFRSECFSRIWDEAQGRKYALGVGITSNHQYELRIAGINKQMLFDDWLLMIREAWFDYASCETT